MISWDSTTRQHDLRSLKPNLLAPRRTDPERERAFISIFVKSLWRTKI